MNVRELHWYDRLAVDMPEAKRGEWRVERFTISEEEARFASLRAAIGGTGERIRAGNYTRLKRNHTLVMSDTPDEKSDHMSPLLEAERRPAPVTVLVGGLGLGMVTTGLLSYPQVTHVTVIEQSPDVLWLTGRHLQQRFGDRLHLIEADLLTWKPPKDVRWTLAWWDIWDAKCMDNLDQMATLHRRFARRVEWQGSWSKEGLRYRRRQERRMGWRP